MKDFQFHGYCSAGTNAPATDFVNVARTISCAGEYEVLMNRHSFSSIGVIVGYAMLIAGAAHAMPRMLPMGQPIDVSGISAACTGVGISSRNNERWSDYPVRFEFVGAYGQYLGDETVTVSNKSGTRRISVSCGSPWVLMQLMPGKYQVIADMPGGITKARWIRVPQSGQRSVVFRYPQKTQGAPT